MRISKIIFFAILSSLVLSTSLHAQLDGSIINELAEEESIRWQQFLDLSDFRTKKFKSLWIDHEKRKSELLDQSSNISSKLLNEKNEFNKELANLFSANELKIYQYITEADIADDKAHLMSLFQAIKADTSFVNEFYDFQYDQILPRLMSMRLELEEEISMVDKVQLNTIRDSIYNVYDQCLVTCLANQDGGHDDMQFEDLNSLLIVEINKDLEDPTSELSHLLKLTKKYESEIHDIKFKYKDEFKFWNKRIDQIKKKHLVSNYAESLKDLKNEMTLPP